MRKDSGMFILGIIVSVIGIITYMKGYSGGSMTSTGLRGSVRTIGSEEVKNLGIYMLTGSLIFFYISGYFRGKK